MGEERSFASEVHKYSIYHRITEISTCVWRDAISIAMSVSVLRCLISTA